MEKVKLETYKIFTREFWWQLALDAAAAMAKKKIQNTVF
jgi:hypothetical protein